MTQTTVTSLLFYHSPHLPHTHHIAYTSHRTIPRIPGDEENTYKISCVSTTAQHAYDKAKERSQAHIIEFMSWLPVGRLYA